MKKKVTSTDIAHAAGVSQSTVSMILNKKYDVSFAKDTVERVENAAKELGYPVLVRPSYVLGGQGMQIAVSDDDIKEYKPDESVLCYAASRD